MWFTTFNDIMFAIFYQVYEISTHHNLEFPLSSIRSNCIFMLIISLLGTSVEKSFNRHDRLHSNKHSICIEYNNFFDHFVLKDD
jgi:hypothetical protein